MLRSTTRNAPYRQYLKNLCRRLIELKIDSRQQGFEHFDDVLYKQTRCLLFLERECEKWLGRAMPVCNLDGQVFFVVVAFIPDGYFEIAGPSAIDWMDCHFKLL